MVVIHHTLAIDYLELELSRPAGLSNEKVSNCSNFDDGGGGTQ